MEDEQNSTGALRGQYAKVASDGLLRSAKAAGYDEAEIRQVPEEAVQMGLGCGNPTALAQLRQGQVVLDLGSGAGLDAFIAAQKVGPTGKVIGIDMTPDMVAKANQLAQKGGYANVEFKLGRIEHLPLPDAAIDVIISNCVVNHAPDKVAVFREALRVLRPAGLLLVSDLVVERPLPDLDIPGLEVWKEWIKVACGKQEYLDAVAQAGFTHVEVVEERPHTGSAVTEALAGRMVGLHLRLRR